MVNLRANVATGVVTIVVAGTALFVAVSQLSILGPTGEPGPGLFPAVLAGALIILGLALILTEAVKNRRAPSPPETSSEATSDVRERWTRASLVMVALIVSILLMGRLGFLVATIVLAALLIVIVERRRSIAALSTVFVLPVLTYVVFVVLLNVDLPEGIILTDLLGD